MSDGVIYILTNPSFENYVKIGFAKDVERRLKELNRSECIPFAFRVYATYEVDSNLSDKKIHAIIDKLNPDLRAIETFNGQKRTREFYAMTPEDAYSILEAIAEIHNRVDKLKLCRLNDDAVYEKKVAQEIDAEIKTRSANFTFSECQIPVGAVLEFYDNPQITCTVFDDRRIEYNGEVMYLTTLAKMITGKKTGVAGPRYFRYKGTWLWDVENRK